MYSLIIADDEEIERKAFRLLINKNFPNIVVLEDAVNGIDFIKKVELLNPDIAIVDINMPGINGLEAVKILKKKGIESKIIIHTAYSYFEYAQEAVSLGAEDYILKPIKREKIISTISNCIRNIDNERKRKIDHTRLKRIVEEVKPIIETDFVSSILVGDIEKDNLLTYLDILGINYKSGYIMTVYMPEEEMNILKNTGIEKNSIKKQVLKFIKKEAKNICNCMVSPIINNKISIFIPIESDMTSYSLRNWSIEFAKLIAGKIKKHFNIEVEIGIGQLYDDLKQLPKSYRESINALIDNTVAGSIKHFGDIFTENIFINPFIKHENEFIKFITVSDYRNCENLLENIFNEISMYEPDFIKDMIIVFLSTIQNYIFENNLLLTRNGYSINKVFKDIIDLNTIQDLKLYMKSIIITIIDEVDTEKRLKINNFVERAINYINNHYKEDISLENIAEKIGISSYYLSRLFKQELNKNFVEYLTEVRINQSIELLKQKNYSIRELSESVGYSNPTYFCKVFKKITGKTIGEFKSMLRINS